MTNHLKTVLLNLCGLWRILSLYLIKVYIYIFNTFFAWILIWKYHDYLHTTTFFLWQYMNQLFVAYDKENLYIWSQIVFLHLIFSCFYIYILLKQKATGKEILCVREGWNVIVFRFDESDVRIFFIIFKIMKNYFLLDMSEKRPSNGKSACIFMLYIELHECVSACV